MNWASKLVSTQCPEESRRKVKINVIDSHMSQGLLRTASDWKEARVTVTLSDRRRSSRVDTLLARAL